MPQSCNDASYRLGAQGSSIRELFAYGQARKAQIGEQNVFDFSIGNPSIPAPPQIAQAIRAALEEDPLALHGYTPAAGTPAARTAICSTLNHRHGTSYGPQNLYLTMGAAAAINCSIHAVCNPGDEVIVVAPFFPEYRVWIEAANCTCVVSTACPDTSQIDLDNLASHITERTRAVILNSPNNPTGTVYPAEALRAVADLLAEASERYGHTIYVIADEPYREVVYQDIEVPWVPSLYDATLVCYSYSKSLSLPGERIGYVLVPDTMPDWQEVWAAVAGAGRALGYVCAPSLLQKVMETCADLPCNVEAYARNRDLLMSALQRMGYTCVEPRGAFYLWVRALEDDARAFSARARDHHELLLVPSNDFGVEGFVRISYCVAYETIKASLPAFQALYDEYHA